MAKSNQLPQALAKSPILWGSLACSGFYGLFFSGLLESEFVDRYFANHPVEYAATLLFFIGLAALAIKAVEIAVQYQALGKPLLGPIPVGGQPVIDCEPLARELKRLPPRQQNGYLARRLRDALQYVRRSGSAEAIDDELKYLADVDAGRLYTSYGLVRILIWAIPILGFLGTVIGIAQAMGNLAPQALEDSLPQVMAGLTVAFDTTKLALGLSIVLMFAQFLTDRAENILLAQVDQRVEEELVGRFERVSSGPDGQLVAVRRMVETLIDSTEQLVRQQTDLWQAYPGLLAGVPDVAGHRELEATAKAETVYCRDDRLLHVLKPVHDTVTLAHELPGLHRCHLHHLADVGTGHKGLLSGAGHYDDPDVVIGSKVFGRAAQGFEHCRVEGVQGLRPVDGNDRDRAVLLD